SGVEEKSAGLESPGQHRIHYAPSKPLHLIKEKDLSAFVRERGLDVSRTALLEVFPVETSTAERFSWGRRVCLSRSGSWTEAATKLFATLRSLDTDKTVDVLVALECAPESLGLAISDRLRRASAKTT
ncbi:MAG: Sua5 family C-terminal domain-containing protein, partial [Bdellovibrionota bacterium]